MSPKEPEPIFRLSPVDQPGFNSGAVVKAADRLGSDAQRVDLQQAEARALDGAHDLVVAGAAAQVARQPVARFLFRRVRVRVEERLRGDDEAGRADAALEGGAFEDISFDYLVDTAKNLFVGSAVTVRQMIEDFHDEVGGFGQLLVFGFDYVDKPQAWRHSLELLSREVMPKVQHLKPKARKLAAE